jgi:glycosyltransferase involved in cell wall biosynthesis
MTIRTVAYFAYSLRQGKDPSGLTTYVQAMSEGLKAHGVRPRVLTHSAEPGDADAVLLPGSRVLEALGGALDRLRPGSGGRLYGHAMLALGARRLDRAEAPAVIEVEEHAGLAGMVLRAGLRAPVVLRLHGPHFLVAGANGTNWDAAAQANDRAERTCVERAAAVSAPSRDVLARAAAHWNLDLSRAAVIPNPTRIVAREWRWEPSPGGPILFVGRFDRTKGADVVVRAFRDLARGDPARELWIVGQERPLHDGDRVHSVASFLASELPDAGVRSRVRFLGPRTAAEVAGYRKQAACVVVASRFETFCLTATEAMMAGCPLVASAAGAIPEIVEDGRTGILFASGDPSDLARALRLVLADPALAARLGEAARKRAEERYAPTVVAERMLEFYRQVAA